MKLAILAAALIALAWLFRRGLPWDAFEPLPVADDDEYARWLAWGTG